MDPITALGVAGNVVQLVDSGIRLTRELIEFIKISPGDVPKSIENVNTQLPLLINAISRLKSSNEVSKYDNETRYILQGVAVGCLKLISELEEIIAKIKPLHGESVKLKLTKALKSIKKEERIRDIERGLQAYIQVLILHHVVDSGDVQPIMPEEPNYFVVKEKRIKNPIERDATLEKLDELFYQAVRSQKQTPQYVILHGEKGVGKSHIALEYCYQSFELGQFRTILWLEASTPEILKLSLESAAAEIRRSKSGDSKEKLEFMDKFLTERWHPWLLVVDNYDHKSFDAEPLMRFLPKTGYGAILITTRNLNLLGLDSSLKIYKFLTPNEKLDRKLSFITAVKSKDMLFIKDALEKGFEVNSLSEKSWSSGPQPIINIAAQMGYVDGVKVLLENGADPCLVKGRVSAPGAAIYSKSLPVLKTFLDFEDRSGHNLPDEEHQYLFRYTIQLGYTDFLKVMLDKRGYLFDADKPLMTVAFIDAAAGNHVGVLRHLFSINKLPSSAYQKANMLEKAIMSRNIELVEFLIKEVRLDPNELNDWRRPALCDAMDFSGQPDDAKTRYTITKLLLDAGASPNIRNASNGSIALHQAASLGDGPVIQLLLAGGADPTIEDEDRNLAILNSTRNKDKSVYKMLTNVTIPDLEARQKYFSRIICHAAETDNRELGVLVLKEVDINIPEETSGDTPLLLAIKERHVSVARMFIRNGAKQTIRDKNGKLPVLIAAEKGLELVVRDLIKAEDTLGPEVCDESGNTPLMIAARFNHEKIVKELLALGAEIDNMNQYGETALDIAEEMNLEKIIKALNI